MTERIAAAAILFQGEARSLPPPARHHTITRWLVDLYPDAPRPIALPDEQGFVTDAGRYVDRIEGAAIALAAGQTKALQWPPSLFSEDLW